MEYIDQIGHKVELFSTPTKIVSVVPSQTELLCDLGLDVEVVGITKFCIHPQKWYKNKNRVGGTKTLNFEKIKELQPDLIIANKEENTKEEIEELQKLYPVWTSDISNLKDSIAMINTIGEITNRKEQSNMITSKIIDDFNRLDNLKIKNKSTLYFIWQEPYMSIGNKTFISDIMRRSGFANILDINGSYPELSEDEIKRLNPDYIFLSSEPYPFKTKHINKFQNFCPNSKVVLVDGEMFSWYGSRLTKTVNYIVDLHNKIS